MVEDMPDLTGKVAIVSGGSRGIGEATVSALVQKGCEVHIIGATESHASEATDHIASHTPSANSLIHSHLIDLGHLASVISLSQRLASTLPRIDMLFLIAGVGVAPFGLTQDGLGNHFAVNHLSQMVIVDGVLEKMKETARSKQSGHEAEKFSSRIVSESSELHRTAPGDIECESEEEMSHEKDPLRLYSRSKLFNILFIRELAKKHLPPLTSPTPILALSVHPGAVNTEQQKGMGEAGAYGQLGKVTSKVGQYLYKTPEQGSESAVWAGTAPAVAERREDVHGMYFTEADGKVGTETSQAQNDELARKLWGLSVKILKDKVDYEVKM